ncbi:hypothetical protein [Actinomadura macrotermitis]|uniref:Uncharacterized protein n=1 Tax=Actinomadura macrotermitis TaxID=2585200 RepID=A0A7K0BSX0_9ACTN|nr:hypothetical protein [Actinomadura macrotermitis]MQY04295.1 hypothetical protein [Actinomadura macrotermitis]
MTTANLDDTRDAFGTVHKYIALFGAIGAIVLGIVAVMALTGHEASPFMWIRGTILFLAAFPLHRFAVRAAQGSAKALDRLRTLSVVLPIAIIGVDLIPGLCPAWYAVVQGLSALALAGVAVLVRRAPLL